MRSFSGNWSGNAVDATQKLKRLSSLGHYNQELGNLNIKVAIDKEAKTLTISDSGIGMTAEEIKKYINQVALSGATEFMEKFKEATMLMKSSGVSDWDFIPLWFPKKWKSVS